MFFRLEELINTEFQSTGKVSDSFLNLGLKNYHAACEYVQELPYGRVRNAADFRLVLSEKRGTCGSKHALLAKLAQEQGLPIQLMVGIYEMTESNTPGVGSVLEKHALSFIPEAHCYLKWEEKRFDCTRKVVEKGEPITKFLLEESIRPEQIGAYKRKLHQHFIKQWADQENKNPERLWHIREECIARLEE